MNEPIDVSPKPPADEVYLGDGLYASFDGFMIRLRAPRADGDHEVFLDPSIWDELRAYAAKIWEIR